MDDTLSVQIGQVDTSLNVLANDKTLPTATILTYGGPAELNVGDVAVGSTYTSAIGAAITITSDGSLTYDATGVIAGTTGTDIFFYAVANAGRTEIAQVTVRYGEQPVAQDDLRLATDFDTPLTLANTSGLLANDVVGTPEAQLVSFGGGTLGGTVADNQPGAMVAVAGGSLTVNGDGSLSLTNAPFDIGPISFSYRLSNEFGTSDADVSISVENNPVAQDDAFTFDLGANQLSNSSLLTDNGNGPDNLGDPSATIQSFGGGSLGGTVSSNVQGSAVALADGMLTVGSDGSWTLTGQPFTPGTYSFDYLLANNTGDSTATVTLNITEQPLAQNDAYSFSALSDAIFVAATGLLVDNGNGADAIGFPNAAISSFGGGDLGGSVTDNIAGSTATLTGANGDLTVNDDGSFSLVGQPFNQGTYSFNYRLTNAVGTSDGTVTLTIVDLPVAKDDLFSFSNVVNQTAPTSLFLDNGNGADTVSGASISSFGGGSLGGLVTTNSADSSVPLAGGTLTVNSTGGWSLTGQPFTPGQYTFTYRLQNIGGSSDATVTLEITAPPTATSDGPAISSIVGTPFHSALNVSNSGANDSVQDLDQNDSLGFPQASVSQFGSIQFNDGSGVLGVPIGTVMTNVAGATVSFSTLGVAGVSDGSLTVTANGSFSFVPPTNYTGLFGFQYRLSNSVGSDTAGVVLAVGVRPQCSADNTYTDSVNVPITVLDGANDALANDTGDVLRVFSVQGNTSNVGVLVAGNTSGSSSSSNQVLMNANGSFNHSPAAGVVGANTFNYEVANGFGNGSAACAVTVTTASASGTSAWFIDSSAAASNNWGTFSNPFTSIANFNAQNAAGANQPKSNDRIYIDPNGSYNEADGINLLNGQNLSGGTVQFGSVYNAVAGGGAVLSGAYATFAGTAEGTRTEIASTVGDGVDLAENNTVSGINIGNTPAGFGLDGTVVGSLTISDMNIIGTGGAIRVGTSGNLNGVSLGQISSTSSVAENIRLIGTTGTLTIGSGGAGLIGSGDGSNAVTINSGAVDFAYAGSVTKTNNGRVIAIESGSGGTKAFSGTLSSTGSSSGILVQNNTGGTINFSGVTKIINTSTNDAITLNNNAGAVINFLGGNLDIDTTTGRGFRAVNSGTIAVSGSNNSIVTGSGTAVDIFNSTIASTGVTFRSVSSNGGTVGIGLNNTGAIGGFTITGDGSGARNSSGGTIQNKTQDGISLINTRNVTIRQLNLTDNATENDINSGDDHAIDINNVTNFIYEDAVIDGFGSASFSHDNQHSIAISNLYGVSTIDNVVFNNINENAVQYTNTNSDDAAQDVVTISNSTFNDHLPTNGESAVEVEAQGTSNLGLVVSNSTFNVNSNGTLGVLFQSISGSNSSLTVQNSTFNAGSAFGSGSITTNNFNTSSSTIVITGNTINNTQFTGIDIRNDDDATTNVTVSNNVIDGNTVLSNNGFGIRVQQDENGEVNALIDNNTMNDFFASQLRILGRDTTDGSGVLNATVTNNRSLNAPADFIFGAEVLAQDNNTVCTDFRGNNFIGNDGGFPGFGEDIHFNRSGTATLNVEQTSTANVTALNNADTVSVGGVVTFGAANFPQPKAQNEMLEAHW